MRYLIPVILLALSGCNADKGCADRGAVPAKGRPSNWKGNWDQSCDLNDQGEGNVTAIPRNSQ